MANLDQEQEEVRRLASAQLRPCGYANEAITVQWIDEFQDFVILLEGNTTSISEAQLSCVAEVGVRAGLDFQFKDRSLHRSFQMLRDEAARRAYPNDRGQPFTGNSAYRQGKGDK